ncbi:MAG: metallophosphoesterase family protein [Candidatus Hydrogenedentes bacterium]|nr:metallophosphoesterase family protein [Candidatus Hydrogenedentota bacterium]
MQIAALTDIHGRLEHIEDAGPMLRQMDVVLLPGDLTMFGRREAAEEVVNAVRQYCDRIFAVMGNCDYPEVEAYLEEEGMCLHRKHVVVDGVAFAGLGGSLPCPIPTLNEWSEETLAGYLEESVAGLPDDTDLVLVSHQPAKDTAVDLAGNGQHVGSDAVREFIETHNPLICFSGHIHESDGVDTIGQCTLVNPGPFLQGRFAVVEIGNGDLSLTLHGPDGSK